MEALDQLYINGWAGNVFSSAQSARNLIDLATGATLGAPPKATQRCCCRRCCCHAQTARLGCPCCLPRAGQHLLTKLRCVQALALDLDRPVLCALLPALQASWARWRRSSRSLCTSSSCAPSCCTSCGRWRATRRRPWRRGRRAPRGACRGGGLPTRAMPSCSLSCVGSGLAEVPGHGWAPGSRSHFLATHLRLLAVLASSGSTTPRLARPSAATPQGAPRPALRAGHPVHGSRHAPRGLLPRARGRPAALWVWRRVRRRAHHAARLHHAAAPGRQLPHRVSLGRGAVAEPPQLSARIANSGPRGALSPAARQAACSSLLTSL